MEIWKRYDMKYEVSNFGNVRNEERELKQWIDNGYYRVAINSKPKKVHQLVAIVFLNHVPNGMTLVVDHIDNNPLNNHVNNLQLISNRENSSKDKITAFTGVKKKGNRFEAKIQFNGRKVYLGTFDTPQQASEQYQKALLSINNETFKPKPVRVETSQYKGVCWHKVTSKWMARHRRKHLGLYKTEIEAHEAYQKAFLNKIASKTI